MRAFPLDLLFSLVIARQGGTVEAKVVVAIVALMFMPETENVTLIS
jgi:hypothetical protein